MKKYVITISDVNTGNTIETMEDEDLIWLLNKLAWRKLSPMEVSVTSIKIVENAD